MRLKKSDIKMTVHLAEMYDANPGKMFTGKGSIKNEHYIVKKNIYKKKKVLQIQ